MQAGCRVAIIGGGPSGIYCALTLLEMSKNVDITVFERGMPLSTLLPTGGGRCNLSHNLNNGDDFKEFAKNYPRGEKFLYSIFSRYFLSETRDFFKFIGVDTYSGTDNRVFPVSNSSSFVAKRMLEKLKNQSRVKIIKKEVKNVKDLAGFDKVVIATGSKTGYELATAYGHTVTPLAAALCGYITKQKYPPGVVLSTTDGDILFTHQGISGPFAYKHSSINAYKPYPFKLEVPLIDPEALSTAIAASGKKTFLNILSQFVPKSLASVLSEHGERQACHIKKEEIKRLEKLVFDVLSPDSKGETVRAGGVSLKEINSNMQSKINEHVYFCGEVLDIDGFCGGFNLQSCWSTAAVAALSITGAISK
ncbi:flavoprotein HI0933 family [Candidatus Gastranaerophilus sp. (ex Termes propinquus)]|nr:flavoprotein HI0933 family [Candidatus Gastranaerophilus sp. (ex Termes propinquus)]